MAKTEKAAAPEVRDDDRETKAPSFGMCEGTRQELAQHGRAVDPFTGERRGDWTNIPE